MILLNLNKPAPELICPHCERPMSEHGGVKECGRARVSRRFFMGGLGLAAAGTAAGLAFTQRAQAALSDFVVEELPKSSILDGKPLPAEIVTATPRVHRGGALVLTYWSNIPEHRENLPQPYLQSIADREGRTVIYKNNGEVHVANPKVEKFEERWQNSEPKGSVWALGCDLPD